MILIIHILYYYYLHIVLILYSINLLLHLTFYYSFLTFCSLSDFFIKRTWYDMIWTLVTTNSKLPTYQKDEKSKGQWTWTKKTTEKTYGWAEKSTTKTNGLDGEDSGKPNGWRQQWIMLKSVEIDQDNLHMKFSALIVDFHSLSFHPLLSRSPPYWGNLCTPFQNTLGGSTLDRCCHASH